METPNDYYDRELDPVGFNQKKKVEASEQRAMINMIQYPRVSEYFDSMKKHFEQPLRQVALALSPDKKYLMDKYLPANILKMFNGLEIHNLNKAFSKFQNEITLETFIVIGFRILDIPKNESPYVLFGMMNLYHSLTTNKGKKTLSFRDFLNNFIRIQSMFSEHKGYVNEENKTIRFLPSSIQDNSHHENPIRNAYYSKSLKLLFSLDEGADHIRVYTANAEFKARINPDKRNHFSRSVIIIMDFAWSETKRKIGICFQNLKLGFFSYEDNFNREEVYSTDTLHTDIWYIEFCGYWFSTDVAHNLYYWDSTYTRSKITGRSKAKVSNVSEIASLGLIAISSYDKKISFFNPTKNVIVLTITQDDCSAHTLKYSKEQNLFFAATFGQMVRIYQIDKSRDYTKIGKLESPAATTAIDILDNQKMILTCDDEGNLKSWDSQNFKSLQHYVLHSSCPITKIIGMEDMGKFCTVTNRLNMFDFTHVTANSDKNQQVVPFVRYCAEKEEIIVALNNDIRVFSLRYGILSELYDKELYNVDETKRISYFKKSAKGDNTFFVDHKGFVRQLTVATNAKANQGFQPFKSDNGNFIFYEPDNLLVTWHRNNLAIYRYETNTHTHLLLRSITFPEVYQFTGVKVYRSKGVLATIINNSCLVFWEFHKLNICGVFINYDDTLKIELDDSPYTVGHGDIRSPRTRSPSYAIQIPSIIRDNNSNTTSNASGGMSPLRKKQTEEKAFSLKIKFAESAYQNFGETGMQEEKFVPKPVVNNSGSEILDLLFIENYNCFVLIDGKYDIYLVEQKGFEEFGAKVKLNLASRVQSLDYYYVKAKVKAIDFKPLIEEKAIRLPEIAHLYVEPESSDKDEDIQYLLFLCDSENQLIILNLNEVLQKYFKPAINDMKFKQPYFSTKVELHDIDVQKLLTKGKQGIKVGQNRAVEDIPMSKINVWKAGDSPVLDSKVVIFNTIVIITISQNYLLQIWNIKGELIGQLHIKDTKCSIWDLNQYNVHQRVEVFQKTMDIFNDIYDKYQKEIHTGCDNLLDKKFSDKIRQELIDNEPKTRPIRETRIRRTLIAPAFVPNFVEEEIKEEEKATVKANYVLNRDRKLLVRKKSVDETFDQDNSGIEALQKKSGGVYLPSTYTQNIAKKLAEMDDDGDSEYGLGRLKKKKKRKGKGKNNASTSGLGKVGSNKNVSNQNVSKQNHDKSSYNDLDYMDVYTNATRNEVGFSIPGSRIDVNGGAYSTPISEKTILKDISRATKRVNFLKDLDFRMKKSKNADGSVDIKETVIGVHQSYLQSGKPRIYGSSDNRVSMKSIQTIDLAEKSNLPSKPTKPKTTIRVHDIYDFSADRTILNGSVTTKDSSFASRLYANQNKSQLSKTRLPLLKYDPQVDQEIISNMDALERLNKKMSRKAKDMSEKKEYIDLGIEIDIVRGSRKKSLQKHG